MVARVSSLFKERLTWMGAIVEESRRELVKALCLW